MNFHNSLYFHNRHFDHPPARHWQHYSIWYSQMMQYLRAIAVANHQCSFLPLVAPFSEYLRRPSYSKFVFKEVKLVPKWLPLRLAPLPLSTHCLDLPHNHALGQARIDRYELQPIKADDHSGTSLAIATLFHYLIVTH